VLNIEIWSAIPQLPYDISNLGNVRRQEDVAYKHKDKTYVRPYINRHGYLCINLWMNSKCYKRLIHRLKAQAFIPNPNNLPCINHKDGIPLNNSLDNLEWCTHQYNMQHAWDTGLHDKNYPACAGVKRKNASSQYHGVSWSEKRQKWCVQIKYKKILYLSKRFNDEIEAAKAVDACIKANNLEQFGYVLNFN